MQPHAHPSTPAAAGSERLHASARWAAWLRALGGPRAALLTVLLLAPCAFLLARQIATLSCPLIGEHAWRQSDVYAVAYNFAHEDGDFFHPRIDWTNGKSGIMGMEPPILPYLIAGAMRLFGDDAAVGRWLAWSLCMIGLLGFAGGLARERGAPFGALCALCVLLSPLGLFELRQLQPDAPMTLLAAAAALRFARAERSERARDYAAALALYTLSVLLKGPAIVVAPAMALFAVSARPVPLARFALRALPLLVPLLLLLAWFHWADVLNATFSAHREYFALAPRPGEMLRNALDVPALEHVFLELYPRYASDVWLWPATAVGLVAGFAPSCRRLSAAFLVWLACVSVLLAAFSARLHAHWYYADLALPPLAYFTAHGLWLPLAWLLDGGPRARRAGYALAPVAALLAVLAARDALAALAQRSDAAGAAAYRAHVLQPLRAAVARYTTRADLIATNRRDPSTLHAALRKGFTMSAGAIAHHRLAYFAKRHAVLYVHFGGPSDLPREIEAEDSRYPLLLKRKEFRVYCLQRVCPELPR